MGGSLAHPIKEDPLIKGNRIEILKLIFKSNKVFM